jgi:hypothetical protein
VTDSAQGSISPDGSCTYPTAEPNTSIFFNYYKLQVSEPGVAELRLTADGFTPYLQLLDSAGGVIQGDTYGGGLGSPVVKQQLRPGSYLVQVFSIDSPGAYTLRYTFTAAMPGDSICPVYEVEPGKPVTGAISDANCRTAEGASQVYSVVIAQPGTLELDMQSSEFVPLLSLRDAKDNRIVHDDNFGNITNAHITADLPAGTYTVVAATGGLPGGYTFKWQLTPHELASCSQSSKLELNSGYIGVFGAASCRGPNGQPIDYYQFTTPADGSVALVMTSPAIDSFLSLQSAGGTVLRWDDNSYGGFDSFLVQFLPGATYRVAVQASNATSTGYYRLDVLYVAGERPAGCLPLGVIGSGTTVQGTLTFTGCPYSDDTFANLYQLEVTDTSALDLRLDSSDFDSFLVVLDKKGNVIDEDDNSGGGKNALVSYTFDAGTYFVVVKPFNSYTSTGNYTLTLTPSQ